MIKTCHYPPCNETFRIETHGRGNNRKFCSLSCQRRESEARRKPRTAPLTDRVCRAIGCSAIFTPRRKTSNYCSDTCMNRQSARSRATGTQLGPYEIVCWRAGCGEKIITPAHNRKYCSTECKSLEQRKTRKVANRASPASLEASRQCGIPSCTNEFKPSWTQLTFCSDECEIEARRNPSIIYGKCFGAKECKGCGEKFLPHAPPQTYCTKQCKSRNRLYREKYDMSYSTYLDMKNAQGGVCKICKQDGHIIYKTAIDGLVVDHCHDTGKIRGLLCNKCNQGLGLFKDSIQNLRRAADYLESQPTE
ncbi:endonuclease VII domain-containing protein [Pseudomonas putida]|uniref:endonuclease VII domain-containing protein n=1 Tax=Pseudomonas TaxID=286 RepID=UPI003467810A